MIPKIIHLCWLSGDEFPPEIRECLSTWKEHLKQYDIWLWGKKPHDLSCLDGLHVTEKQFDLDSTEWTQEAFEARKYAFAADYIRLYALYRYGGIYLDSDIIMYKPFDPLLTLPYFIGHDQIRGFEAAVIGATPGVQWIKDMLDSYDDKHFVKEDGTYDMLPLPCRFHHVLTSLNYKFYKTSGTLDFQEESREMMVFDKDFFNSRNAIEVRQTRHSFCAHNYAGSWNKGTERKSIKSLLPKWVVKLIYTIGQKTWARNKYAWFQINFEKKK